MFSPVPSALFLQVSAFKSLWNVSGVKKDMKRKCFEPVPWEWYEGENYKYETSDAPVG